MPAVARTSPAKIVAAARRIVERHGPEALSMQAVAHAVGIQAPSMYKHFTDRAALLRAVSLAVAEHMQRAIARATTTTNASDDLRAIARAQRSYAVRSPHLYALLFATSDRAAGLADADYAATSARILDLMAVHGEPRHALAASRLLVSFVHGFSTMEAAGAFHLGGSVDDAFEFGLDRILAAVQRANTTQPSR